MVTPDELRSVIRLQRIDDQRSALGLLPTVAMASPSPAASSRSSAKKTTSQKSSGATPPTDGAPEANATVVSAPTKPVVVDPAASLAQAQRDLTKHSLNWFGRAAYIVATVGLGLPIIFIFASAPHHNPFVPKTLTPMLALLAALVLIAILAVISITKRPLGLVSMLIGGDGRLSTSYFQAWIWTIILSWALLYFVAVGFVQGSDALNHIVKGLNTDYLLLLGGPFAALVIVQGVDQSKIAQGDLQKVSTPQASVSDLLSNDSGRTDLVDTQYLLFNFVAIAFFFGSFLPDMTRLPDIPDTLIMLTSASALGYVGKKVVQRNAPSILSIVKANGAGAATPGAIVRISGVNFLPAGSEDEEYAASLRIRFGAATVTPFVAFKRAAPIKPGQAPDVDRDGASRQAIDVMVPDSSDAVTGTRYVDVVVVTPAGVETPPYSLQVTSPLAVSDLTFPKGDDPREVTFVLAAPTSRQVRVMFNDTSVVATQTNKIWKAPVPAGLYGDVAIEVHANGSLFATVGTLTN